MSAPLDELQRPQETPEVTVPSHLASVGQTSPTSAPTPAPSSSARRPVAVVAEGDIYDAALVALVEGCGTTRRWSSPRNCPPCATPPC